MDLKKRLSLRGLMASRGKGATSPEALKVQTPVNLPPSPPLPPVDQGPRANPDLKKKRPIQELKEGRCSQRRVQSNRRQKTIVTRGQSLWRVETMLRSAVRSACGLL